MLKLKYSLFCTWLPKKIISLGGRGRGSHINNENYNSN